VSSVSPCAPGFWLGPLGFVAIATTSFAPITEPALTDSAIGSLLIV